MPVVLALAPLITRIEFRMNDTSDATVRRDLRDLPPHLDRIDGWIADGVLGGEPPNAADLQIATTLRLLHSIGDVRPLLAGRPAETLAFRWFERLPGSTPPASCRRSGSRRQLKVAAGWSPASCSSALRNCGRCRPPPLPRATAPDRW